MSPASTQQRFRAAAIDLLFLCVLHWAVVLLALAFQKGKESADAVPLMRVEMVMDFALILAGGGLEVLGTSLGKRIVGLRICTESGAPAQLAALAQRWTFKFLPLAAGASLSLGGMLLSSLGDSEARLRAVPVFVLGGLLLGGALMDFLFCLGIRKRAIHDRLSQTAVVSLTVQPSLTGASAGQT